MASLIFYLDYFEPSALVSFRYRNLPQIQSVVDSLLHL